MGGRGPGITYHCWVDECAPAFLVVEKGKNERNSSRAQEDNDELVLELLQNELPNGRGGFLGDHCEKEVASAWFAESSTGRGAQGKE